MRTWSITWTLQFLVKARLARGTKAQKLAPGEWANTSSMKCKPVDSRRSGLDLILLAKMLALTLWVTSTQPLGLVTLAQTTLPPSPASGRSTMPTPLCLKSLIPSRPLALKLRLQLHLLSLGQALHSRGENGSVRMDSLLVIQRAFTKVEFFEYGAG